MCINLEETVVDLQLLVSAGLSLSLSKLLSVRSVHHVEVPIYKFGNSSCDIRCVKVIVVAGQ